MRLDFKILFPSGYQIDRKDNDNIDINVVTSDGKVYFATLFTLSNIEYLMKKDNDVYFWSDSMLIISDLQKITIKEAISRILSGGYTESVLNFIGNIENVYGVGKAYHEILDMV